MIYLDHHAATPLSAAARAAMETVADVAWANPSSAHGAGRRSRAVLEDARRAVAEAVGARPADLVFTSGGTEACQLAIDGLRPTRVALGPFEHPAVRAAAEASGVPILSSDAALEPGTLVALQWVNHETGATSAVTTMAEACRESGAMLFVDATQALGRIPVDVGALGATAVAFASHKIGGPSGAGALHVERGRALRPTMPGGGQERGRRGGSPSVLALAGFGAAARALPERLAQMSRVARWRDRIETLLVARGGRVNGAEGERVASATNVSIPGWRAAVLVAALDLEGVMISAGAACSSGVDAPSPVITALYPDDLERAASAIRVSFGPEGLDDDAIEAAAGIFERVLQRT